MQNRLTVKYETFKRFGIITLSNPPYNHLTDPVFENPQALSQFLEDEALAGAIIKGNGKHFSAGADLERLHDQIKDHEQFEQKLNLGKEILNLLAYATIPVIAVIRGSCMGAGLEIALSCHFRFSTPNALFGFPESEQKLMPGLGGTILSVQTLRKCNAIELILSGEMINGESAKKIGMVNKCVASGELDAAAIDFLTTLTKGKSSRQIRAIMTSINNSEQLPRNEALEVETKLFCKLAKGLKP